jgi:hypothetical protein
MANLEKAGPAETPATYRPSPSVYGSSGERMANLGKKKRRIEVQRSNLCASP